jgi:hypothetical protein
MLLVAVHSVLDRSLAVGSISRLKGVMLTHNEGRQTAHLKKNKLTKNSMPFDLQFNLIYCSTSIILSKNTSGKLTQLSAQIHYSQKKS